MSIWKQIYGSLVGGWRTYGPNSGTVDGAFASNDSDLYQTVTAQTAMNISALWACMCLRAETIGSLPIHLRDQKKNIVRDHPLYYLLHDSPNADMTAVEFWSLQTALQDMYGNSYNVIERNGKGEPIALNPLDSESAGAKRTKSGRLIYTFGQDEYPEDRILHLRGFGLNGLFGASRLEVGRRIFANQLAANEAATRNFKQGLKLGGMFKWTGTQALTGTQQEEWERSLTRYNRAENIGKYLTLPKGMEVVPNLPMRTTPAEAELLASQGFGVEEVCRLMNTPPQLIGHTNKASSWASSIENINLYFKQYSIQPSIIRNEQRLKKKLMSSADKNKLTVKFNVQGLERADSKTRALNYASALQNGYRSRNEVRDLEDLPPIPGGDEYTVQLNMTSVTDLNNGEEGKNED